MQIVDRAHTHWLRRTFWPYVGQIVIAVAVSFFVVWVKFNHNVGGIIFVLPVIWALLLPTIFFGLKYRIGWDNNQVVQEASGITPVRLRFEEIDRVEVERSTPKEMLASARPFRRIVIYGKSSGRTPKKIDVSLKHFATSDIDALMKEIGRRRPEFATTGSPNLN